MAQDSNPNAAFLDVLQRAEELVSDPETRVPIIVCIDCSYSMAKQQRLKRTMDGFLKFCNDMMKDPIASDAVELCIISYGGNHAKVEQDFSSPKRTLADFPQLNASGETPLLEAVNLAKESLASRCQLYDSNGINHFRPWIIIIGDGDQTSGAGDLQKEAQWLQKESDSKRINVMCVVVGDEGSLQYNTLIALSPDHKVQYLRDLKFREFFSWLSRSVQKNSQSLMGEELNYDSTSNWGDILG